MKSTDAVTLMLIVAYFVAVFISLRRRGRELSGQWLFLLRGLFPNWRFYHDVGHQPRLFFHHREVDGAWTEWLMYMPRARFKLLDLVHAPYNNLELAQQNLVDHLSADINGVDDGAQALQIVSYRLTDRLVRELLRREGVTPHEYQFEIRLVPPLAPVAEATTVLTSSVLPWT